MIRMNDIENKHNNETDFEDPRLQRRKWFWQRHMCRQIFMLLTPLANLFSTGLALGTPTVLMPQLRERSEFRLTKDMESWLYSVHGIGTYPSVLMLPVLSERYGRRPILFIFSVINVLSFTLQYFSKTFATYLAAEVLQGLVLGNHTVVTIIYIAECSAPKYRGLFLAIKSATYIWGIWVANTIGTFTDSKYSCVLGFVCSSFASIGMIMLPESPIWLAKNGQYNDCKEHFVWLRGKSEHAMQEFKQLISHFVQPDSNKNSQKQSTLHNIEFFFKQLSRQEFYWPFSLCVACFSMFQFCGKMVVAIYALDIVQDITHDIGLSYKIMLIIDGISICGMYIGCYLALKLRRRLMFLSFSLAGAFSMYLMSLLLFLNENSVLDVKPPIMLGILMLYSFAVSMGPMAIANSMFAEIVPQEFKTMISSTSVLVLYGLQFVLLKFNPYLMKCIGLRGVFLLYACMSSLGVLFLYCFLPETKDKTLAEIEETFASKRKDTEPVRELNESRQVFN